MNLGLRWIARKLIKNQIESLRNSYMCFGTIRQVTTLYGYVRGCSKFQEGVSFEFDNCRIFRQEVEATPYWASKQQQQAVYRSTVRVLAAAVLSKQLQ